MRRFLLYLVAMTVALVFYVLHQHLRVAFYPYLMPPMTPALLDAFFVLVYALCGFVMVGALVEQVFHIVEKRRKSRPKMVEALTTAERARAKAQAGQKKEKVFY